MSTKVTKKTVVSKYRQGNGWIVSSYCPAKGIWILSPGLSYATACLRVKNYRKSWDTRTQTYLSE